MEDRLTRLEEQIAYQQHVISQLDEVVRQFASRVERLEEGFLELRAKTQDVTGSGDEKPPHY